jgi:hypothetical protein
MSLNYKNVAYHLILCKFSDGQKVGSMFNFKPQKINNSVFLQKVLMCIHPPPVKKKKRLNRRADGELTKFYQRSPNGLRIH